MWPICVRIHNMEGHILHYLILSIIPCTINILQLYRITSNPNINTNPVIKVFVLKQSELEFERFPWEYSRMGEIFFIIFSFAYKSDRVLANIYFMSNSVVFYSFIIKRSYLCYIIDFANFEQLLILNLKILSN